MTEVATNFQMTKAANCPLTEEAQKHMKEFQSAEVDAILKQVGETNLIVPGGWTPVNSRQHHIQELGKFAVDEHNKKTNDKLVFMSVFGGLHKQMELSTLYWLLIQAKDCKGNPGLYTALVNEYYTGKKDLLFFSKMPLSTPN